MIDFPDQTQCSYLLSQSSFKFRTKVLDESWRRWQTEYLLGLRERFSAKNSVCNVKIGQVVMISEDNTPRLSWKLGIIEELIPSLDSHTRSVKLRTNYGFLVRSVKKLIPLELETNENFSLRPVVERVKRQAAIAARSKFATSF